MKYLSSSSFGAIISTLVVLVGVFVYSPTHILAATIAGQSDSSVTANGAWTGSSYNNLYGTLTDQTLGSGLHGTVTGIRYKTRVNPNFSSLKYGTTTAYLYHSSNSSYSGLVLDGISSNCDVYGDSSLTECNSTFSPITLDSSKYYVIIWLSTGNRFDGAGSASDLYVNGSASCFATDPAQDCAGGSHQVFNPDLKDFYFELYDSGGSEFGDLSATGTRITAVTPSNGSTIATTSAITTGATGYVDPVDYVAGMYVRQEFYYQGTFASYIVSLPTNGDCADIGISYQMCAKVNGDTGQYFVAINYPISASGNFSVSTSSAFGVNFTNSGRVSVTTTIVQPHRLFGLVYYGSGTLVSTSTSFVLGAKSYADVSFDDFASTTASRREALLTADVAAYCNPLSGFDGVKCITALFIPSHQAVQGVIDSFKLALFDKWPIGYISRIVTIFNTSNSKQLPSLVFNIPSTLPGGAHTIDLTPWGKLTGTGSYVDSATSAGSNPKTLRQIIEAPWQIFVYTVFGIMLVMELIGLSGRVGTGSGGLLGSARNAVSRRTEEAETIV